MNRHIHVVVLMGGWSSEREVSLTSGKGVADALRQRGWSNVTDLDMDALPMNEDTGLDFASTIAGRMHACGHDTHTAMLAGAARVLAARADALPGEVRFMLLWRSC